MLFLSGFTLLLVVVIVVSVTLLILYYLLAAKLQRVETSRQNLVPLLREKVDALYDKAASLERDDITDDRLAQLKELCMHCGDAESQVLITDYREVEAALPSIKDYIALEPYKKLDEMIIQNGDKYNEAVTIFNKALYDYPGRLMAWLFLFKQEPFFCLTMDDLRA